MYTVRWCGHDGNERELRLKSLDEAMLEARGLARNGYEGITITRPDGSCIPAIWPEKWREAWDTSH